MYAPCAYPQSQLLAEVDSEEADTKKKRRGKKKRKAKRAKEMTETPTDDTTAGIRQGQTATLAIRMGSLIGGYSGAGGEALYHLKPNLLVGAFFASGTTDLKEDIPGDDLIEIVKAETSYSLYYLQGRYYLGNSFFLNGGLGMRTFKSEFRLEDKLGTGVLESSTSAQSVIVQFGLGNIWRFQNGIVLGAEWLGYTQPLSSSFSSSTEAEGAATPTLEGTSEDAEDLAKFTAETGAFMGLVLSLGYSF